MRPRALLTTALFSQSAWLASAASGADFVNPLIGTVHGGHVFAGASLPFSMAKAVADVTGENQAGFGSDFSKVRGFSHMHDSGTGGVTSLGNFPLFPHAGCPGDDISRCNFTETSRAMHYVNGSVEARPGYFALILESGVRAEMTVANHTALYRFTFPETPQGIEDSKLSPVILTELSDLSHTQRSANVFLNHSSGQLTGKASFIPSFGTGSYRLHFCADFKGASIREVGAFNARGELVYPNQDGKFNYTFDNRGAFTRFNAPDNPKRQITARVGVSFISIEQACNSSISEIPDFDFDGTLKVAEKAWREKLDVISIKDGGVDRDTQVVFWSGIYRNFISPQDYTGENYLWKSDEPYYDSYYCIWDSFRAQHPLLTMLDPHSQTLMVRSLIEIWRHEGHMPDCRMSLCKGWSQGGSNADVVLADAYIKGLNRGINWTDGYLAVVTDAEVEPGRWDLAGRGGLASWKDKGYIPIDDHDSLGFGPHTRSVSRTVEYAYNDFCVAQMAATLNNTDYEKYMNRSSNWKNLLRHDQTSMINGVDTGFQGVLQPKYYNASWAYQDPLLCSPLLEPDACYLTMNGHETYEGSCWLYTFFIPGDIAAVVAALGTEEQFVERLDFVHESGMLYMGDEQAFLTPFLYHYVGRPGLSAKRAHFYVPSQFNNTLVGIPGNDDSGAMGAFASFIMMGVFPNAGQNVYFITPPYFQEISIRNPETGKTATIRNINFDPEYGNIFIQKATLNGQPYSKNWIDHGFFLDGGVLELVLGPEESNWGSKPEDRPPSLSTGGPANGTWDTNLPSRMHSKPGYNGLLGPHPAYDPIKLLVLTIVLLLVVLTSIGLYYECVIIRRRKDYRMVPGTES